MLPSCGGVEAILQKKLFKGVGFGMRKFRMHPFRVPSFFCNCFTLVLIETIYFGSFFKKHGC